MPTSALFAGGALAVVWAVLAYLVQRRFLSKAVRTTGVVESLSIERTPKGTVYFPIIRFATADGTSVSARANRSGSPRVGQSLAVLYDPAHPDKLEIDKFFERWAMVLTASGLALVLFAIGIAATVNPRLVG